MEAAADVSVETPVFRFDLAVPDLATAAAPGRHDVACAHAGMGGPSSSPVPRSSWASARVLRFWTAIRPAALGSARGVCEIGLHLRRPPRSSFRPATSQAVAKSSGLRH